MLRMKQVYNSTEFPTSYLSHTNHMPTFSLILNCGKYTDSVKGQIKGIFKDLSSCARVSEQGRRSWWA